MTFKLLKLIQIKSQQQHVQHWPLCPSSRHTHPRSRYHLGPGIWSSVWTSLRSGPPLPTLPWCSGCLVLPSPLDSWRPFCRGPPDKTLLVHVWVFLTIVEKRMVISKSIKVHWYSKLKNNFIYCNIITIEETI